MGRLSRHLLLGVATLAAALTACAPEGPATAFVEHARLVHEGDGTPVRTYTLADETRPVVGGPTEHTLRLPIATGQGATFTFTLPPAVQRMPGTGLIATGAFQRGKSVAPLAGQRLTIADTHATLTLPPGARGPGTAPILTLSLTRPPAEAAIATPTQPVHVPPDAELHFAYGLSEAAAVPETGPIALEIAARVGTATETIWSTTLEPSRPATRRWQEATVSLAPFAEREVMFTFRARAASDTPTILVPLWGDPTIVAPGVRPAAQRNVILISLDTLRADRVGVYGAYRPTTPALDALAKDAAVLTNAWAPWPETSGSHMSLFTSRYPSEHGVTGFITAPAKTIELLAERLRRDGYLTRAFTENGGVWAHAGFARGFSAYGERRSPDFVYRGEAADTFSDAIAWLETHTARTFFLFVHTYEVHAPYAPPADYQSLFTDSPPREPGRFGAEALAYDRETRHADHHVGRLVDALRRLGLARRSIVVITSDHGEEFGEHGGRGHGRSLHREVLHIPMLVWAPGLVAPARLDAPATLLDLAPTILDLVGLDPDPTHRGQSLAPTLRGGDAAADGASRVLFAEVDRVDRGVPYKRVAARRAGRTAILDLADESIRCYGADDPGETRPTDDCADLVGAIVTHREQAVPAKGTAPDTLDPRLIEKMRALGYLD